MKIAFLTTMFLLKEQYVEKYFESLNKQTYKDFDLILVNDGYKDIKKWINRYNLNYIVLDYSDTPAKNREFGINWCINNKYDIIIFGDFDDYFEKNRVEKSIELLKKYDLLVNDVTLFDDKKLIYSNYFSNRLNNNQLVDINFILDKNIFGFSNSALKISNLEKVTFPSDLIAVDWYFFSNILLNNRKKALFTNETITYYRQYSDNLAGLGNINTEKSLQVKKIHYQYMMNKSDIFKKLYCNITKNLIQYKKVKNPLWWEI